MKCTPISRMNPPCQKERNITSHTEQKNSLVNSEIRKETRSSVMLVTWETIENFRIYDSLASIASEEEIWKTETILNGNRLEFLRNPWVMLYKDSILEIRISTLSVTLIPYSLWFEDIIYSSVITLNSEVLFWAWIVEFIQLIPSIIYMTNSLMNLNRYRMCNLIISTYSEIAPPRAWKVGVWTVHWSFNNNLDTHHFPNVSN